MFLRALLLRADNHEVEHGDHTTEHEDVHDEWIDSARCWCLDECESKHEGSGMLKQDVIDVVR